jgi:hypothetical protein
MEYMEYILIGFGLILMIKLEQIRRLIAGLPHAFRREQELHEYELAQAQRECEYDREHGSIHTPPANTPPTAASTRLLRMIKGYSQSLPK